MRRSPPRAPIELVLNSDEESVNHGAVLLVPKGVEHLPSAVHLDLDAGVQGIRGR